MKRQENGNAQTPEVLVSAARGRVTRARLFYSLSLKLEASSLDVLREHTLNTNMGTAHLDEVQVQRDLPARRFVDVLWVRNCLKSRDVASFVRSSRFQQNKDENEDQA